MFNTVKHIVSKFLNYVLSFKNDILGIQRIELLKNISTKFVWNFMDAESFAFYCKLAKLECFLSPRPSIPAPTHTPIQPPQNSSRHFGPQTVGSGAQMSVLKKWTAGLRGPTVRGPKCQEPKGG